MNNYRTRTAFVSVLLITALVMGFLAFSTRAVDLAELIDGGGGPEVSPQDYDLTLQFVDSQIKAGSTNPLLKTLKVKIYLHEGRFDEVIADCDESIRKHTNAPDLMDMAFKGCAYFGKKDYAKAIADFTACINAKPVAAVFLMRGASYENSGDYDKAIADYSDAILIEPKSFRAFWARAICYGRKSEFDLALSDFGEVIHIVPVCPTAYADRGQLFFSKGDYASAVADYTKALLQDEKCALAYNNLAWLLAVCPDEKFRDGGRAVSNATRACDLTGWKNPMFLGTLAAAYAEKGDFAAAGKWQEESIKAGLPDQELKQAQERLELYQQNKPYRVAEFK